MNLDTLTLMTLGEVPLPNGEKVTVRGLSPADIMGIVQRNKVSADALFKDLASEKGEALLQQPQGIATKMFEDAPMLVADAIAIAMDEPREGAKAAKLPVGLQIKLVEEIIRVTTFVEGGLGELIETVIAGMVGATSVVKAINKVPRSMPGSGESESR
jgi:hypothetical protein